MKYGNKGKSVVEPTGVGISQKLKNEGKVKNTSQL